MKYTEISVLTTREGSELIAEAFFSIGGEGAAVYDKADAAEFLKTQSNWDYADESLFNGTDTGVRVVGYVKTEELPSAKAELNRIFARYLSVNAVPFGSLETTFKEVNDADYYEVWKKYYQPIHINQTVIVPKWIPYVPKKGETTVLIDPGMAFGTGEHESTRLCIELMTECGVKDKTVLDIGAGSGILGIAALRLGAKTAALIDIDATALRFAHENVILNGVESRTEIVCGDLLEKINAAADIVFANLTADILIRLSKSVYPYIAEGGAFICSGIIHERAREVKEALLGVGLHFEKGVFEGEWQAFMFSKSKR